MAAAVTAGTVEPPPITKLGPGDVPARLSGPCHSEETTVTVR
jgi:hypothetical protein